VIICKYYAIVNRILLSVFLFATLYFFSFKNASIPFCNTAHATFHFVCHFIGDGHTFAEFYKQLTISTLNSRKSKQKTGVKICL